MIEDEQPTVIKDSVDIWIKNSWDDSYMKRSQKEFLHKAYNKIHSDKLDSWSPSRLSSIAYRYYKMGDTVKFKKINNKALNLAIKIKDSFTIADTHWSFGEFYINKESFEKAFYNYNVGYKYFKELDKKYETARMLYSMAFIKGRYRDYSGSEVLNVEAIKLFQELENNRFLYMSYSHLGTLQVDIRRYDKALEYQFKALSYIEESRDKNIFLAEIYNNIGFSFSCKGEHLEAIKFYDKSIQLSKNDIENYARVIDNHAYSRLQLNDTLNVEKDMLKSLKIRDSINDKTGVTTSLLNLSRYYSYIKNKSKAIQYAKEANQLAKKIKNGGDYLTSLEQLGDLEPERANEYLKLYSRFSDSLSNAERKTLNKFTRIEFETDEVLAQNKTLGQRMTWIISGSAALLIVLSLLYFIRVQRVKNEKLFLETEQQKANEQVYLLTLKQQATLEEEKARERNRISQELHDGILGRLFGTRVGLGFLELEADEKTQQQHEAFLDELQDIEKEIREVSHKLNDNFASTDVNFTTIITQLLESKSQIGGFQYHLNIDEQISWKSVDEVIKVNVYRIIQETLQNAIKHANAKNITLDFSTTQNELQIQIHDDGNGFNLKKSKKGIGLKNIKSRVEKLNGSITISSAMKKGTQIHIKIPHI